MSSSSRANAGFPAVRTTSLPRSRANCTILRASVKPPTRPTSVGRHPPVRDPSGLMAGLEPFARRDERAVICLLVYLHASVVYEFTSTRPQLFTTIWTIPLTASSVLISHSVNRTAAPCDFSSFSSSAPHPRSISTIATRSPSLAKPPDDGSIYPVSSTSVDNRSHLFQFRPRWPFLATWVFSQVTVPECFDDVCTPGAHSYHHD